LCEAPFISGGPSGTARIAYKLCVDVRRQAAGRLAFTSSQSWPAPGRRAMGRHPHPCGPGPSRADGGVRCARRRASPHHRARSGPARRRPADLRWRIGDPGNLRSSGSPRHCYVPGTAQIDLIGVPQLMNADGPPPAKGGSSVRLGPGEARSHSVKRSLPPPGMRPMAGHGIDRDSRPQLPCRL